MKKYSKVLSLALAFVMLFALCACGAAGVTADPTFAGDYASPAPLRAHSHLRLRRGGFVLILVF